MGCSHNLYLYLYTKIYWHRTFLLKFNLATPRRSIVQHQSSTAFLTFIPDPLSNIMFKIVALFHLLSCKRLSPSILWFVGNSTLWASMSHPQLDMVGSKGGWQDLIHTTPMMLLVGCYYGHPPSHVLTHPESGCVVHGRHSCWMSTLFDRGEGFAAGRLHAIECNWRSEDRCGRCDIH